MSKRLTAQSFQTLDSDHALRRAFSRTEYDPVLQKTHIHQFSTGVIGKPSITNTEIEVDTEFTVTWSAPQNHSADNNTKYRLEWRKKPVTNDSKVGREENINDTSFRITGLQHNTEYEIKLYAVYRQRESEPDVRTFKTKPKVGKCLWCL